MKTYLLKKNLNFNTEKKQKITVELSLIDLKRSMNFIKRFLLKTQLYNLCLVEIFSFLHLMNLKRNIDVTSPEEATNIQVLLLKPMEDKMY